MANILDVFKNFLSPKNNDSIVGIDIGSSSIKVVQLKKVGSSAVLETYGTISLGQFTGKEDGLVTNLDSTKIQEALISLTTEAKADSKNVGLTIPGHNALLFTITLPESVVGSALEDAVKTESRNHVPVNISDVNLDWMVLPKRSFEPQDQNQKEILVVAVLADSVNKIREIISSTDLDTRFLEVEFFSLVRSSMRHELSPTMIIDFGAQKTKVCIVEAGIVRQVHIINRGGYDISNSIALSRNIPFARAEDLKKMYGLQPVVEHDYLKEVISLSTDYILSECQNVVLSYEKKYNKAIHEIILTGGGSRLKGLYEKSTEIFQSDVVYADPFSKTKNPDFLEQALKTIGPEYAHAIGVALRAFL